MVSIELNQLDIIEFLNQDKTVIDEKIGEKVDVFSQEIFHSIGKSLNLIKEKGLLDKATYVLSDPDLDNLYVNSDLSDVVNHILSDSDVVNEPSIFKDVQISLKNENLYEKLLCCEKRKG
ncbi:MAG: hypothetical protein AAGG81_04770, partial [Chlamydiota bacterium]